MLTTINCKALFTRGVIMTKTITHKYLRNLLDNLSEENFDDFLIELQYSTLIVPVIEYSSVPIIEGKLPLFTDLHEFHKFNVEDEYRPVTHHFNDYLELLSEKTTEGFIINPDGERYIIPEDILNIMEPNYIFDQEYQVFTTREIRHVKESINNWDLNEFLKDKSNQGDLAALVEKLNRATLLTLLVSDEDFSSEAEDGVICPLQPIPKCLYEVGDKNYLLLFSREITTNSIPQDVYKYSEIVNFPLLVEFLLNDDLDGFILNVDEENITIPREHLRDFMKDFRMPLLDDYSMYVFTVPEGD